MMKEDASAVFAEESIKHTYLAKARSAMIVREFASECVFMLAEPPPVYEIRSKQGPASSTSLPRI